MKSRGVKGGKRIKAINVQLSPSEASVLRMLIMELKSTIFVQGKLPIQSCFILYFIEGASFSHSLIRSLYCRYNVLIPYERFQIIILSNVII